ncbi:MAG: hypothetical protein ACYC2R_06575 [Burkholderiales bacterium]
MKKQFMYVLAVAALILGAQTAVADGLKPFVLASKGAGSVAEKADAAKAALTANGFAIVGTYSPYPNATILIVTNNELKSNAAKSDMGGFGAAQRVAITKVKDEVQVSYTNAEYMANAYRMKGDLKNVEASLEKALGKVEEFGAKGLSPSQLRKYHYTFGMEYFNEPKTLAEYGSYDEAVKAVEDHLKAAKFGVTKVYRIDIPGKKESVFGVALNGSDKNATDKYIMSQIDFRDVKSTAYLLYEMLVADNKVIAQYARFRIAIDFPDLSMMGSNSFMSIMAAPDAINKVLRETATGKEEY